MRRVRPVHVLSSVGLTVMLAATASAAPLAYNVIDSDPTHPSGVVLNGAGSHLMRDSAGRLVATYTLATQQSTQYYNYARTSMDDGATWSAAVRTETMPDSSSSYSLVVDSADVLHLGFGFNVGAHATRSLDNGATWQTEVALLDGGWGAWDYGPQLAIDTAGVLHGVYYAAFDWSDPPYNVQHVISTDSGATFATPVAVTQIPNDDAAYDTGAQAPALEAGPDGQLFLVYNVRVSATNAISVLRRWDGAAWGEEIELSSEGAVAGTAYDLGVDSEGIVHIAYVETGATATAPELMYRTYDPATSTLSDARVVSATGDSANEVTLGVYSDDVVLIGYSLYDATTALYGGVKLLRSGDDFASAEVISTSAEARSPSLRFQFNNLLEPEKADLVWVEVSDVTGGEMLVHAIPPLEAGGTAPVATVTGFRVQAYGPRIVNPGQDATFLVQYDNGRDHSMTDTVITVSLPLAFPYVKSTHSGQLLASGSAQEVYWRLGTVEAGARGFLGVTLRIPWAVPEGTSSIQLHAGAEGGIGSVSPADYPETSPSAVAESTALDAAAVSEWLASDGEIQSLVDRAQALGYLGPFAGDESELGSGDQVTRLFMVSPETGLPAIVTTDGTTPYIRAVDGAEQTVLDANGGYRLNKNDGSFEPFGDWAITHSPSVARCQLNCTLSKVPGWAAEAASKTISTISTGIDCVKCAQTKGKDTAACTKCANAYHDVPGVGQAVDVAECLNECLKNPEKYVCTKDKRECSNSWYASLVSYAGKSVVAVTYCNTTTGTYDPIDREIPCDRGETCVAGACLTQEEMCGAGAKDGYEDATCSLTDFEVVPAHDPNAKHVTPAGDVVPGTELTYTIEYENTGSGTAMGVFVLDTLSDELDASSIQYDSSASWSEDAKLLSWEIGDLEPGTGGEVEFKATVPEDAEVGTTLFNIAEVHFPSAGEVTPTNPVYNVVGNVAADPKELEVVSGESKDVELSGSAVGSGELAYAVTRQPLHGALSGDVPALEYASEEGFVGQDDFEFVVSQGKQQSAPARVVITVQPSSDDETAPTVTGVSPEGDDVRIDAEPVSEGRYMPVVTATLSESIDPATVDSEAMTVEGVEGQVAWDASTRTLSFTPSEALTPGREYEVAIGGSLADYAGNELDPYTFAFTTAPERALRSALDPSSDSLVLTSEVGEESKPSTVAVVSVGTETVSIDSVTITGSDKGLFSIDEQTCKSAEVAPGESCFVSIVGQSDEAGSFDATLVIESDADGDALEVPLALTTVDPDGSPVDAAGGATGEDKGAAGEDNGSGSEGGSSAASDDDTSEGDKTTTSCGCRTAGANQKGLPAGMLAGLAWLSVFVLRRRPRQ